MVYHTDFSLMTVEEIQPVDKKAEAIWSVYLVRMAAGSLYCGISTDVERRFVEHQKGARGARALKGKGPLSLVFQQAIGNRSQALKTEYHIKQMLKRDKEKLITGEIPLATILEKVD